MPGQSQEEGLPGGKKGPRRWQELDLEAAQGLVGSQCHGRGLEEEMGGAWAGPVSETGQRGRVGAGSGVKAGAC